MRITEQKKSLYYLKELKQILDKYKIPVWLDSGTLLGYIRDKKMISWDHDIDIATKYSWIENDIINISKELQKLGYNVLVSDTKLTIKKEHIHISLYFYKTKTVLNEKYLSRDKISKKKKIAWFLHYVFYESILTDNKDYYYKTTPKQQLLLIAKNLVRKLLAKKKIFDILFNLGLKRKYIVFYHIDINEETISFFIDIDYYGIPFLIPGNPEKYLKTLYGDDWMTPNQEWDCTWSFYDLMKKNNKIFDAIEFLEKVTNILDKEKIYYWMYGGALLGYVRSGTFISWDTDIDLFVWVEDYKKIINIFKNTDIEYKIKEKSLDLRTRNATMGFQFYTLKEDLALIEDRLVTKNKLGNIIYFGLLCPASKYGFKNIVKLLKWIQLVTRCSYIVTQKVPAHFFLYLKEIDFYGIKLKVPRETEDFLKHTFGQDWETPKKKFDRPRNYYLYGGLPNSKYRKYYKNVPGWKTKCIK